MQCPYCAEDIREEALLCRYCGGDLRFFVSSAPVQEKISSLEERMTNLEKTSLLHKEKAKDYSGMSFPVNAFPANAFPVYGVVMGVLSALASTFAFHIYIEAEVVKNPIISFSFLLLAALLPLPLGILVGVVWDGKHPITYIVIGLSAGLLALAGHYVWIKWAALRVSDTPPTDWPLMLAIFPFGATWLFLGGGLIGDMLADRWDREVKSPGSSRKSLSMAREVFNKDKSQKERWEIVKDLGPQIIGSAGVLINSLLVLLLSNP